MRRSIPSLPVEIWLYISEFLSPTDRRKLIGLSRLFFELVMDELYRKLCLITSDPWSLTETMESLEKPVISSRVRVVTFWPSSTCNAIHSNTRKYPSLRTPKPARSARDKLLKAVIRLFQFERGDPIPPPPKLPSSEALRDLLLSAISNLTNVQEVNIKWHQGWHDTIKPDCAYPSLLIMHFWSIVNPNIRRITIDTECTKLADIVPPLSDLPLQLEHLDLKLRSGSHCPVPAVYAPFINGLAGTLQSLSLTTICGGALELLGTLSHLKKLYVHIPIHNLLQTRVSGLHQFLEKNPTIEELSSQFIDLSATGNTIHNPAQVLPNLRCLKFGLHRPPSNCGITLNYLGFIGRDLTALHFTDHILFLTHARHVLDAFTTEKLQELYLSTKVLSPELIDLVAIKCPRLLKLCLEVDVAVATDNPSEGRQLNDEHGFVKNMLERKREPHLCKRYQDWKLQDVSILQWVYGEGRQYNWEIMNTIATVVPTVRSFVGQGHMRKDGLRELEPRYLLDLGERSPVWS